MAFILKNYTHQFTHILILTIVLFGGSYEGVDTKPITPSELQTIIQSLARGDNQNRVNNVGQFMDNAFARNGVYYYNQNGFLVQQPITFV